MLTDDEVRELAGRMTLADLLRLVRAITGVDERGPCDRVSVVGSIGGELAFKLDLGQAVSPDSRPRSV